MAKKNRFFILICRFKFGQRPLPTIRPDNAEARANRTGYTMTNAGWLENIGRTEKVPLLRSTFTEGGNDQLPLYARQI